MQSDEAKDIVRQATQSRSYTKLIVAHKQDPRLIFNHHLTKILAMKLVKETSLSVNSCEQLKAM